MRHRIELDEDDNLRLAEQEPEMYREYKRLRREYEVAKATMEAAQLNLEELCEKSLELLNPLPENYTMQEAFRIRFQQQAEKKARIKARGR